MINLITPFSQLFFFVACTAGDVLRAAVRWTGARQEKRLNELHFAWNVDIQAARWHHLLHEARRFKARPL